MTQACSLLKTYNDQGKKTRIYAGGTDLINFIKVKAIQSDYLVDIKPIKGLDQITYDPKEGLTICALAKLRDIELSPIVKNITLPLQNPFIFFCYLRSSERSLMFFRSRVSRQLFHLKTNRLSFGASRDGK